MADNTKIEWADATLNYVNGCSVHSPGCTNCYAMRLAGTRLKHHPTRAGLTADTKAGPVWTGEVRENPAALEQALRWKKPRAIFWNAHGDLFHENVPWEWIARNIAVCILTPQHRHMILTKRSDRMRAWFDTLSTELGADDFSEIVELMAYTVGHVVDGGVRMLPIPNLWLGVSVEDQRRADERIPDLLATPAAIRFISAEPLLGPIELGCIEPHEWPPALAEIDILDASKGEGWIFDEDGELDRLTPTAKLDWVIVGGESGPGARPMHPDWARSLRDQCADAGVPFLHKQNGEFAPGEIAGQYLDPEKPAKGLSLFDGKWTECWSEIEGHTDDEPDVYRIGKARAGRLLDGVQHDGVPG